MIKIKTIEELESERERQLKAWIDAGKDENKFYLNLEGADLTKADLNGADLTGAKLTGAILYRADLVEANLSEADLIEADLRWADLRGAKIKNTIITQSEYDYLLRLYSHEFMSGFIVKELEE